MSRGPFLRYLLLGPFVGAEFVPRTECFDGVDGTAAGKKCCDGTIASKWCWDDRFTFDKCCQAHWRIWPIENHAWIGRKWVGSTLKHPRTSDRVFDIPTWSRLVILVFWCWCLWWWWWWWWWWWRGGGGRQPFSLLSLFHCHHYSHYCHHHCYSCYTQMREKNLWMIFLDLFLVKKISQPFIPKGVPPIGMGKIFRNPHGENHPNRLENQRSRRWSTLISHIAAEVVSFCPKTAGCPCVFFFKIIFVRWLVEWDYIYIYYISLLSFFFF